MRAFRCFMSVYFFYQFYVPLDVVHLFGLLGLLGFVFRDGCPQFCLLRFVVFHHGGEPFIGDDTYRILFQQFGDDEIQLGQPLLRLLRFFFLLCYLFFITELLGFHQEVPISGAAVFCKDRLSADGFQHHLGDLIQGDVVGGADLLAVAHIPPAFVLATVRHGFTATDTEGQCRTAIRFK